MNSSFSDWVLRRKQIGTSFPNDLLEDLKEQEPALYHETLECDSKIAQMRPKQPGNKYAWAEEMAQEQDLLPSILTKGWDDTKRHKKYTKNWADMENLLKLYALGLYFKDKPLTEQAWYDKEELTHAVEMASLLFAKKKRTAQQRLLNAPSYLAFGERIVDIYFHPDELQRLYELHDVGREISEAYRINTYHASRLETSRTIAERVVKQIRSRYI